MKRLGIENVLQLAQMEQARAEKLFSILMVKTIDELNGNARFSFDDAPVPKKQLMCSRSFAEKMTLSPLRETICEFSAKVAERLRSDQMLCRVVNVFVRTSMYCPGEPTYSNSATARLSVPTADTMTIMKTATELFDSIWKDGYRYAKTGVMLSELCPKDQLQLDLFESTSGKEQQEKLMAAIDQINQKGNKKIWFGSQRPKENWFMRQAHLSKAYTTRWEDLPKVT